MSRSYAGAASMPAEPATVENSHVSPIADNTEELRRLRAKNAELKAIIAEANEERSALREQIAALTAARADADEQADAPCADERTSGLPDDGAVPLSRVARKPLIPAYSTRARRSLRDLPASVIRETLSAVAGLAIGDEAQWHNTKQLVCPDSAIFSSRVGIRYRVLFALK